MTMKLIVLDLDDTIFETEKSILRYIHEVLGVPLVWTNRLSRNVPEEKEPLEKTLENGSFMLNAEYRPGFWDLMGLMERVRAGNPNVDFAFVTHRGYHPNAPELTRLQFERLGFALEGVFLDYNVHPCKKTWLDENIPGEWYLFDDHPKWNSVTDEKVENIFLMDQPWNQEETAYERIYHYGDFERKVLDIAGL